MDDPRETGWYRDPDHPDRHRYWDGERWQSQAEHLEDSHASSAVDEVGVAAPVAERR